MSRWSQALDVQTILREFWNDPVNSEFEAERITAHTTQSLGMGNMQWRGMRDTQRAVTTIGTPYWVSPDMCRLLTFASRDMPEDTFEEADIPSPYGIIYLAEPFLMAPADEMMDRMAGFAQGVKDYRAGLSKDESMAKLRAGEYVPINVDVLLPLRIITWAQVSLVPPPVELVVTNELLEQHQHDLNGLVGRLKDILARHPGDVAVQVRVPVNNDALIRDLPNSWNMAVTDESRAELRALLGERNVSLPDLDPRYRDMDMTREQPGVYWAAYSAINELPTSYWPAIGRTIDDVSFRIPYTWMHSDPWGYGFRHLDIDFRKFVLTLLRFSQQRIAVTEDVKADRASRKRYLRAFQNEDVVPTLKVIRLRRERVSTAGGTEAIVSDVNWSHRWEVAGHWHKAAPNWKDQRPRYYHPFVKGPVDKPFVPKKTLYRVDR